MTGTAIQDHVTSPVESDLLSAWEFGLPCSMPQRGVVLLGALLPQRSVDEVLAMTLRERDDTLLQAHLALFGPRLSCAATCPSCAADLEFEVSVDDLVAADETDDSARAVEIGADGWVVRGRPLAVRDVLDAAVAPDAESARQLLLARSIVSITAPDSSESDRTGSHALPSAVEDDFLAELERRNPTGALDFEQTCPGCSHVWTTSFDPVGYLWAELDGWAQRTLREVHSLASAYGWRESDILAMSARRRAAYLELAGDG